MHNRDIAERCIYSVYHIYSLYNIVLCSLFLMIFFLYAISILLVLYAHPIKDLTHNRRIRIPLCDTQSRPCIQRYQITRTKFSRKFILL
ncbi:hypothetical protein ACFW04_001135 [Cataglyphis niger]